MSRVVLMAWSSPASPEVDEEFNTWYDEIHIPQVSELLAVTGKVERYRLLGTEGPARYVAVYRLGTGVDLPTAGARLGQAVEDGRLDMTTAMDVAVNPPEMVWLEDPSVDQSVS